MEKNRQTKVLSIIALVLAITGMSLGFAAFSTTLNISSSASVTPDSSTFKVGFYRSNTSALAGGPSGEEIDATKTGNAFAKDVYVDDGSTTISKLEANFTAPGESVTYSFYVGNSGEYDAYLKEINFNNLTGATSNKVCVAGTGATASLVDAACNDIVLTVSVHDINASTSMTSISSKMLTKKTFTPITVTIEYLSNGARADGPFTVSFGDISLEYSTVDNAIELISFTLGQSKKYTALKGMTWAEYLESDYNNNVKENAQLCSDTDEPLPDTTILEDGGTYTYNCPT